MSQSMTKKEKKGNTTNILSPRNHLNINCKVCKFSTELLKRIKHIPVFVQSNAPLNI